MKADKLTIQELRGGPSGGGPSGYCIQWELFEDGDLGAVLGEDFDLDCDRVIADQQATLADREHAAAALAAASTKPERAPLWGFYWFEMPALLVLRFEPATRPSRPFEAVHGRCLNGH